MLFLNSQSKETIVEQIKKQVLRFIELGVLKDGDRLPSVRQLAQENGINPNTVAKAYRELEEEGYLFNQPKRGAYVNAATSGKARLKELESSLLLLKKAGFTYQELSLELKKIFKEETC